MSITIDESVHSARVNKDEYYLQLVREIDDIFHNLLEELDNTRGDERSDIARRFSIVITEVEKARAYFNYYILEA